MAHRFQFTDEQWLPASPEQLFPFFMKPTNLSRIMGDAMRVEVLHTTHNPLQAGAVITYNFIQFGLPMRWTSRIVECVPNEYFIDEQERGPFAFWRHKHILVPHESGTRVIDDLQLTPPFGLLGRLAWPLVIKPILKRTFTQRKETMERLFPATQTENLHPTKEIQSTF